MPTETSKTVSATALPDLKTIAAVLSHPIRWHILKYMAGGGEYMALEIANAVGCSTDMASKHLAKLHRAGLVAQGHAHLYQIPKPLLPAPGTTTLDCGLCVLRLDDI